MLDGLDDALEKLLRDQLPLPAEVGDVSFDAPDRSWASRISRVTVNAFLFDIGRCALPFHPGSERRTADGLLERQDPLPMVTLSYLVSAWAGSTREEHSLLGDLLACVLRNPRLPAELQGGSLPGPVTLGLAQREGRKPGDVWSSVDGRLRPAFELEVSLPVAVHPWQPAPAGVDAVVGRVQPTRSTTDVPAATAPSSVRRRSSGTVVLEGRRQRD